MMVRILYLYPKNWSGNKKKIYASIHDIVWVSSICLIWSVKTCIYNDIMLEKNIHTSKYKTSGFSFSSKYLTIYIDNILNFVMREDE